MRFLARAPRPHRLLRALPAPAGARFCLLLVLAALAAASPSLAEEFDLARLTEDIDLALEAGNRPVGELVANLALGRVALNLQHRESMGDMGRPLLYGRPKNNPPARSSLANARTRVDLAQGVAMPAGISFGLDEWDEGSRDLRLIAHNGLHLADLRVDHRLTLTNSFATDRSETRRSAGRLALGLDLLGGRQEGAVEYDATPLARLTHLRMKSAWDFDGGSAAVVGLTHRPLVGLSEGRLGFRQPVGVFEMTSDVVTHSQGGYVVGLQFSLPLGPTPQRESWSLSALVSSLRAGRQLSLPVESEALPLEPAS